MYNGLKIILQCFWCKYECYLATKLSCFLQPKPKIQSLLPRTFYSHTSLQNTVIYVNQAIYKTKIKI